MTTLSSVFLTATAQQQGSGWGFWIMILARILIMYFFRIRPQHKKQKELANFRNNLQVGDEVMTAGGIYGRIRVVEATYVMLEVADGVRIKVDKNSIYANVAEAQQQKK